ncbi:MAG: GyrI-like domain-containing protein [Dehalococcoidales bacterium]|nr:GyrI-like domain-containing protein [Dehalococcoidales bacterium]
MIKLDFKKEYKQLYSPSHTTVSVVDVPVFNYIMVNGQGAPDGDDAQQAIQALFPVAYTIKFMMKKKELDYTVMPFEGLWWADDMGDFVRGIKNRWKWTYMIMQPDFVSIEDFEEAIIKTRTKNNSPSLSKIYFKSLKEGKAAQILHIGPFSNEHEDIKKIPYHIIKIGGDFDGHNEKHHEIYLSDLRKVSPDRMKTILRQPFTMS